VAVAAREPLVREIRLTWWREQIAALVAAGEPPAQPTLQALADVVRRGAPAALFEALIDAHVDAIEGPPERAAEAVERALMRLAAAALDPVAADAPAIAPAARAWALRNTPGQGRAVTAALAEARAAGGLSVTAFPAVAHATMARAYVKGREPSPLARRLRLTAAVLTGRL